MTAQEERMMTSLVSAVRTIACTCQRQFTYSGTGVEMCRRCAVLVNYEELNGGKSPTLERFKEKKL